MSRIIVEELMRAMLRGELVLPSVPAPPKFLPKRTIKNISGSSFRPLTPPKYRLGESVQTAEKTKAYLIGKATERRIGRILAIEPAPLEPYRWTYQVHAEGDKLPMWYSEWRLQPTTSTLIARKFRAGKED